MCVPTVMHVLVINQVVKLCEHTHTHVFIYVHTVDQSSIEWIDLRQAGMCHTHYTTLPLHRKETYIKETSIVWSQGQ